MNVSRKRDPHPPRLPEWIIQRLAWSEDRFSIQENLSILYVIDEFQLLYQWV